MPNEIQLGLLNGTDNGSLNPKCYLNESWQFCTQTFNDLQGVDDGSGLKKFRFAVVEATAAANLAIYVDAVTLTVGDKAMPAVISYKLTNTRNTPIQTKSFIPQPNFGYDPLASRLVTSNILYDNLGRAAKTFLPHVADCAGPACNTYFSWTDFTGTAAIANTQYIAGNPEGLPDAGGIAYSEPVYEQDQATSMIRTGMPGTNFQKNSGHTTQSFYSGAATLDITGATGLGADFKSPANRANPKYSYQYGLDENGHGSMEWKDGFGQVLRTAAPVTEN
ncbi:MAG: hypothetical protein M3Y08_17185, partial [Fibrobacterota bacterium]|nr:hypothetical protein [Fibrobacterota bacterium]